MMEYRTADLPQIGEDYMIGRTRWTVGALTSHHGEHWIICERPGETARWPVTMFKHLAERANDDPSF